MEILIKTEVMLKMVALCDFETFVAMYQMTVCLIHQYIVWVIDSIVKWTVNE
jgi:hypothetical protein